MHIWSSRRIKDGKELKKDEVKEWLEVQDEPVVACGPVWFRLGDGPLSSLAAHRRQCLLLLAEGAPPAGGAGGGSLCRDAGLRSAGGQLSVVLVVTVQQLPGTVAGTERHFVLRSRTTNTAVWEEEGRLILKVHFSRVEDETSGPFFPPLLPKCIPEK